jgi:hypothetical protein
MLPGYYVAYTASIIIAATVPSFHRTFAVVMVGIVIPLTVITLLTGVIRFMRQQRVQERPVEEPELSGS